MNENRDSCSRLIGRRRAIGMLGATAAAAFIPRAQAATTVNVGALPFNNVTSFYFDKVRPFQGTEIATNLIRFQGGPPIVQAIQSGNLQIGDVSYAVALSAASRGIPIVCLAGENMATRKSPVTRIMVLKDSPIHSLSDLRGKKVAIHVLGTLEYFLLIAALNSAKIDPKEVNIVTIPVPNQPQALASRQVDAMMAPNPADTVAEMEFGARTLVECNSIVPHYGVSCMVADARWAEKNPGVATQLAAGIIKTHRWVVSHDREARKFASEALKMRLELAERMRLPYWCLNGLHLMSGVWNLYYMMVANKAIEPASDPKAMMRRVFVEPVEQYVLPALKDLGRVPEPELQELASVALPYLPKAPISYRAPWEGN